MKYPYTEISIHKQNSSGSLDKYTSLTGSYYVAYPLLDDTHLQNDHFVSFALYLELIFH